MKFSSLKRVSTGDSTGVIVKKYSPKEAKLFSMKDAVTHLEIYPGLQCSYNYDLVVHTHRGERSTKELNFKINAKVGLEVLNRHSTNNDGYVTKLQLRHARLVRTNGDRTIKHVADQNLEEKLSQPFYFVQNLKGEITDVFYPHDDSPDLVGIKKGVVSAFNMKLHPDLKLTSFNAEEEDDSGVHVTYYDVIYRNSTHVDFKKQWSGDDYLKHADGRPVEGTQHVKSRYNSAVKIEDNSIKSVKRTHFSQLNDGNKYKTPLDNPDFQNQPDFDFKASGESYLNLLSCSAKPRRTKRFVEDENATFPLANLKKDTLAYSEVHRVQWSKLGNPKKPTRTFYELLRCYSDPSVKKNELSQCIKELHYLARTDNETHQNIAELTLSRSHQNFSTWSGLVGALVVKGDYETQKVLAKALLSEEPRPLNDKEHSVLLEAVFFIPAGPLRPELLQALTLLHKNSSKSDEVTVRAMLVMSGLVRRIHEAGYNRSLSENIARYLHQSFKTHPARFHDHESESHETYLRNHIWAFGNLGHASSLNSIIPHLDHDSSGIRYSAVSALRKLSSQDTDHHLLKALKHDEHVTVKAGVIEVLLERRQNISVEMREAIEDALWSAEEGDELDSKITEFLDKHGEDSHHTIRQLRKRRAAIKRKKRALIPALRPREFSFGPRKEWKKAFGGKRAGAEAIIRFVNQVKLQISIFGGKFEVDMDNLALLRAHVIKWHFDVINGKAAFKMSARFKNDIPKDLIHTISDTADDILAGVDSITSIFTKHIQNFIDKLKNYLPLDASAFLKFISRAIEFLRRSIQATRFGNFFSQIVKGLKNALRTNGLWRRIAFLVNKLLQNLKNVRLSSGPFGEAFQFLNKLVDLVLRIGSELPRGLPANFNIKDFLKHISGRFDSLGDAVSDYFKNLGVSVPGNFFGMLHFKITLRFPISLEKFRIVTIRLINFGNNFLEMISVFREVIKIELPNIRLPALAPSAGGNRLFDFGLSFDWRVRFNFNIDFSGQDFAKMLNFFRYLAEIFQRLGGSNVDLEQFFQEFLPDFRNESRTIDSNLFQNTTDLKIEKWFEEIIKEFENILGEQGGKLLNFSETAEFLAELGQEAKKFSKTALKKICRFQGFMLKSSGKLQQFGESLEKDTIVAIRNIEDEAQTVIEEIVNVTLFVDKLIADLQKDLSNTAKKFVDQFLAKVETSLENVKELANNVAEFTSNSTNKLAGFCHKTADLSGEILDQIQTEAENAVKELADFIATNSQGISILVNRFKTVVTNVENWQKKNLQKHVGKFARVAETLEEFLSLLKNENKFLRSVYKVSSNINDVLNHLKKLPEHAEKARQAADKVADFATNANRWETEVKKLNVRRKFKLDFDEKLRKLCGDFQTLAQDSVKEVQGDNLFKTFREFVTKETDALISRGVAKLELLKEPLARVRSELEKVSESVSEVETVLVEMRPFTENFSPILEEVSQLPNCTEIEFIFNNIVTKCGASAKAFGTQVYEEYKDLRSEIKAFLELVPEEWESLSLRKCVTGGTCLSEAFTKQAQGVSKKIQTLKKKFDNKELFESLEPCKTVVEDVSRVVEKVKNISMFVEEFSLKDEVLKIKDLSRRITGKFSGKSQVQKRSVDDLVKKVENLAEHVKKAKETKEEIEKLVEEVFGKLKSIYADNIKPFRDNLKGVQQKLQISYDLSKKSDVINPSLQAVDTVVGAMTDFTQVAQSVVDPLEGTVLDVLSKTSEFTDVFDNKLKGYGEKVQNVSNKVNGFLDEVISFLNKIQLRQKGLDIRDYKPWNQYPHCSEEVCLRLLRRSSNLYLKTVFLWKYPHLDDLSSFSKTGKWPVPGLFDDYKVRSIAPLSTNQMLLGMQGVASNTDKASLLVVVDIGSSNSQIVKIIQLQQNDQPFTGDMGGIAVVKDTYIWTNYGNSLYAVKLSDVRNSMSSNGPSTIKIAKTKSLSHQATSLSYDSRDSRILVVDGGGYKVYSYDVSPFGSVLLHKETLETGQHTRGFAVVRQFSVKYGVVAKCALVAGYQCKLEFHSIDTGVLDESSLHRVVRTPTGLESIQAVDSEHIVTAFSSGTFSEKDKIERIAGDFEDRFFKFKVPILSTGFDITENCVYLKVAWDWIIPARRLFPLGEMKCGKRRKRSALEKALEADVYSEELEKHKRIRRQTTESVACTWNLEGEPKTGSYPIIPEVGFVVVVVGIPVYFYFGADAHYYANYRVSLCLREREVRLAIIPGAWVTVYAGASLVILIVEGGVTVEAKLLETYLIPEVAVRVDKWPLRACLELKLQMTPLAIRVYLWYRFRLCIRISIKKWFKIRISIRWCPKKTFAEWSWSSRSIHKTVINTCDRDTDSTPPGVGQCTAKQVGNKKYFVQWRGFTEDTEIQHYVVIIGSIRGSGDDHYSIHGERQSLLVTNLDIMHGRPVYAAVYAYNGYGQKSPLAHCPMFTARRRSPIITFIHDGETSSDIDYQSDATSLAVEYGFVGTFGDLSSVKWGISSSPKCTLSASEANVLSLREVGESYTIKKTGLELANGGKYYIRIQIVNLLGLATVACSDGVTIDTTPPVPRGFTVGKDGTGYVPSVRRISGKFQQFLDIESPIVHYEWKLVDEDTGNDLTHFKAIPLTQKSPLLDGLSLTSGKRYTAILKGTNAAGLHAIVNVSGIIPDDTIPACNVPPRDVLGFFDVVDKDFVRQLSNLTCMFSCYDDESSIHSVRAAVGTYKGGENVHAFVDIGELVTVVSDDSKTTWITFDDVNITSLVRYYVTIKVRNNAGFVKTISSDGVLIDTTGPTILPSYIRDGPHGSDKKFSSGFDIFPAHWENAFADAESGIKEYLVGLGTNPGSDDVSAFRSNGLSTRALITSSALESGVIYYVTVIACNGVHMCVNGSSNGAMVDYEPPNPGSVIAGHTGPSLEVTWINKAAWARWQWCPADKAKLQVTSGTCDRLTFYDEHSGIKHFGLSVISYDTAELIVPIKTVGRVVVSGLHVVMPNGVFSVVVEAEDRAGVRSNSLSESFIIDSTAPRVVKLHHGNEDHPIMYTRSENHVFSAYFESTEDVSDIVRYSLGVSSYPEGDDVIPFVNHEPDVVSNVIRVNWTSAILTTLINGQKYYISVKVWNSAGLVIVAASPPLIFDNELPLVAHVLDGWGTQDAQYHSFSTIFRMHWRGVTDVSRIDEIKVCLSSTQNSNNCDLYPLVKISNTLTSYSFTNIDLRSGTYFYALLHLKDKAGNVGIYWTNGVLVDTSPPSKGQVTDGQGKKDIVYQRETNILYASWSGFFENETAIHHYELAFGTSQNKSDVQPFTDIGLVTSSASSNLLVSELKNGMTYYAQVIGYNILGVPSEVATSNGVLIDSTAPTFSILVTDGVHLQRDIDYTNHRTTLSASWKCEDIDSGLAQAYIGFGTQPGIQDVADYQAVLPYQTSYTLNNLTLFQGYRYFATVKCVNRIGLQNSMSSNGITVDSTPPLVGYIKDGDNAYQDAGYIALGSHVTANWKFTDPESHVVSYLISIYQMANGTRVCGPSIVPRNRMSAKISIQGDELKHGQRYAFSITAKNGAGLNTTGMSNGVLVDGTAPVCSNVYDVTSDGEKTIFVGQIRKLVIHFECSDNETGINSYHFSIKDLNTSQHVLAFHKIKGISSHTSRVVVDGAGKKIIELQNGGRYQVGIRATNNVNLTQEYWTPGVIVDTTPPMFNNVVASFQVKSKRIKVIWQLVDYESGIETLSWFLNASPGIENAENLTEISLNSTELFISVISLTLGQTYYVYLKAVNKAGRSTMFVSDGVVIDQTPPSTGLVSAEFAVADKYDGNPNVTSDALFTVKWSGFVDQESGIRLYGWAIGLSAEQTKQLGNAFYRRIHFTGTLNGHVIRGQTLYTNTTYYVCIQVMNGAGLYTTSCSNPVFVKLGKLTAGVVYDGPLDKDVDFQLDDKAVWLHWTGFKDPVYGIEEYAWCYGLTTSGISVLLNCTTSLAQVDSPLKTSAHQFHNISLLHGQRYSVKVQASNSRDQSVSAVSDGFTVDRTGPSAGNIRIGGSRGTQVIYVSDVTPPMVSWTMYETESAIKEYYFGIGTSPKADDLYSFTKLSGKHSVNLAEINFNFTHGITFYVTVVGVNLLGLETSIVSPQVIVDWLPPISGVVRDGNGTSDVDFQVDVDRLSAAWSEFLDPESDVVEYFYCIGTSPDICNVVNQTSVNLDLYATTQVNLEHGEIYFVTVTSINGAGLSTTSSSNGLVVDISPAIIDGFSPTSIVSVSNDVISSEIISILTNPYKISATWNSVFDSESEVKSVTVCASTVNGDCNLSPPKAVIDLSSSSLSLDFQTPLQTGTVFTLKMKVENGAGIETAEYSGSIIVDDTPPSVGTVSVRNKNTLVFVQEGKAFTVSWSDFVDPESNIKMFQWKVCSVNQPSDCVSDFVSVGLNTALVLNDVGIEQGLEYNVIIKALNFAELEVTAVSNPFILDKTPPDSGMVFDGEKYLKDKVYQSSSAEISVSWKGFQDKESGIKRYEVCVGSKSGLCDVSVFKKFGLATKAIISNLNLTHNETYFTTVRAVNGAGQTSIATSNGIFIDLTSPEGGSLIDGDNFDLDATAFGSYVSASWDEFHDPESGVLKYVICAGTMKGSCDILPLTTVNDKLAVILQVKPAVSSGTFVYPTLRVYNEAGGVTEVYSDGILVDSTPPDQGEVKITSSSTVAGEKIYLTSKSSICASWKTFNDSETQIIDYHYSLCLEHNIRNCPIEARHLNNKTSLCIEEPPVIEGESYIVRITATNQVGLSSTLDSPVFIIDTTEPDIGEITALNPLGSEYRFVSSAILAHWNGFIDRESGVSGYSVCVGSKPMLCDVTELVSVWKTSSYVWYNLSLVHDEDYFVSIKSINNAGVSTNFTASQPIAVDRTGPPQSKVLDGSEETEDIDYQQSRTHVSATWFSVEDPESDIVALTWCAGSRPRSCDLKPSASLDVTASKISAYLNQPLKNGDIYHVTLKAINGAGLTIIMVSDGVTVDFTPPGVGLVTDGQDDDTDFLKDGDTVYARWSDFEDVESGIRSYQFALCEKENITLCPTAFSDTGLQTNISLSGTKLQSGVEYVVIVRATNMVGLSRDETSDGFTVDATAPSSGQVVIVSPSPSHFDIRQIAARWDNFIDPESDIAQYKVCLGTTLEECDEISYQSTGLSTTHIFTNLKLRHQETYYVTVKATNNAGLSTQVASNEIKIDVTPPQPVKEISGSTSDLEEICSAVSVGSCNTTATETTSDISLEITCSSDVVKATWLKHEDKESGILKVEWCVESIDNMCDVQLWETIPTKLQTKSAVIHSLSTRTSVRVVVRITNGVGNSVLLKSTKCNPVKTFPPKLNVVEVKNLNDTQTDIDYQTDTETILVMWSSPTNLSSHFSVQAALTEPKEDLNVNESLLENWRGEPFAFDFVDIPRGKAHIRFSGSRVKAYSKYRPVVRRCNEVGLCRDSIGDGVVIVPDAPPHIQVNATDTFVGTEQQRWQQYVGIPQLSRSMVEETYFIPDPFSVLIEANLQNLHINELAKQHMGITYEASVYRVTSGANETRNETIDIKHIFQHSHLHDDSDVCCESKSRKPRTIYPDQQIKPVQKTNAFGTSVSALRNDIIVVSSENAAYIFSIQSLESTPITLDAFNSTMNNSFVRVKGIDDIVLMSHNGKLLLYKVDFENLAQTTRIVTITNCNDTFAEAAEYCTNDDRWSSENIAEEFVYDGSQIIAVSGKHPIEGYGVVVTFKNNSNDWKMSQVLGLEEKDQSFGKVMSMNKKFLVIVGSRDVYAYSRVSNDYWQNDTLLSDRLSDEISNANNVYLTTRNELFVLSVRNRTLKVFDLQHSTLANRVQPCQYVFPVSLELTGSFDVVESGSMVAAVGIMSDGLDGSELVLYESGNGCTHLGRVITKNGLRYDDGRQGASVSIEEDYLVIGTPGLHTWPSDYVDTGTGRVYVTTFCPRNSVRRKLFEFGHGKRVACVACGADEKAYPGFEEKCVNCSQSICLENSDVLDFRVSHCDRYPCGVNDNRNIMQNVSRDNLAATEFAQSFGEDEFYKTGSEQSYFIRITQKSASGLTTISDSFPFSLDNSSPEPGSVYDGLGSDENRNCSANTTLSSDHQCSSRSLSDTDLDFTNNTASISARWIDFRDNESDIEHLFWCIGSRPLRDDIMGCENATNSFNHTLTGLSLPHNDTYYVTVLACNYAGLCTARSSDGVLVDTTPPVIHYVRDGLIGPDIDFQVFTNIIFGNWAAEDPESGVVSYEIGWGSSPGLDDLWEFQEIGNAYAYYAKFKHGGLVKGRKYYVTVKAINGAGLESEPMTSNGIVVGKTEFVFAKNDSGSFFFDTVNVNSNETKEKGSGIGNTFGTLDVPSGAVEDEVKFQVYSLGDQEFKDGTDDNTTVVDPEIVQPPKHFKLGNYSFQIKAYEPENNTLQSEYHFKKPITISLFYDVDQMLSGNKKTVSNEVTNKDIDPVLLLWDTKNQTWFDAAKTCPEPWTYVDHAAKMLKVHVCHLTQFALFWTFEAENGIIEFNKYTNGSLTPEPSYAIVEEDNRVIYDPKRYNGKIIFDVLRRKGSTGTINVTWSATCQSNATHLRLKTPFTVSPVTGELMFIEGQWNSSIHLRLGAMPSAMSETVLNVEFLNTSGGAMLGNTTSLKVVFPAKVQETKDNKVILEIVVPCIAAALVIVGIIVACVVIRKRRSSKRQHSSFRRGDNPFYGQIVSQADGIRTSTEPIAETSFTQDTGYVNPTEDTNPP